MTERITLVSLFDQENLIKINNFTNKIKEKICKVPYGKNVEDRYKADTLPYHFTLSAWNIDKEKFILQKLENIQFNKFKILVDSIDIMTGKENSFVLFFNVKTNDELKMLQNKIYNILPTEKYNPNDFKFHITIAIDKNYEKIINIKEYLEKNFEPFELEVNSIGLYEIYPANLIKNISGGELNERKN
jgi:2'-5' RNA ligase